MTQTDFKSRDSIAPQKIDSPLKAKELCDRVIETTSNLISVLNQETQLIKKLQSQDFIALTAKKQSLSILLTKDMELLKKHAQYIKQAAPEQVLLLKEQQKHFHHSLAINHHALSAMKAVSEELLQTIATKASKMKSGPEVYNNDANLSNTRGKVGAISVDTTL